MTEEEEKAYMWEIYWAKAVQTLYQADYVIYWRER